MKTEGAMPNDKFMTMVKIGAKGQIVIPKEAREILGIKEGDSLLLMASGSQGIGILPMSYADDFFNVLSKVKGGKQ